MSAVEDQVYDLIEDGLAAAKQAGVITPRYAFEVRTQIAADVAAGQSVADAALRQAHGLAANTEDTQTLDAIREFVDSVNLVVAEATVDTTSASPAAHEVACPNCGTGLTLSVVG